MTDETTPALIPIKTIHDDMGNLSVVESGRGVPFEIRRVYYICAIPDTAKRGGHSHKDAIELVIPLHGAFTIDLESQDRETSSFPLESPERGLFIPPLYWRELRDYEQGSVCLVLASNDYDENEYLRDYQAFLDHRPDAAP